MDLKNLDIEFLLDKSGSMATLDCAGGKSRWVAGQETTQALATLMQPYDADGITVVPFAGGFRVYENVTPEKVAQVFTENTPMGSTNTAAVLKDRLDAYFARKTAGKAKSTCFLVLTDGAPDDQKAVADVIIAATKKLDSDDEMAISFIQIGQDPAASAFLQYLDDNLVAQGAKFDIVDTVRMSEVENFAIEDFIRKAFAD